MTVWKCDGVDICDGRCKIDVGRAGKPEVNCLFPWYDRKGNWQKTTDFEIVEKIKIELPDMTGSVPVLKTEYPELAAALDQTPNCALCEWKLCREVKNLAQGKHFKDQCSAQAYKRVESVYGNENCIALYKQKETPNA